MFLSESFVTAWPERGSVGRRPGGVVAVRSAVGGLLRAAAAGRGEQQYRRRRRRPTDDHQRRREVAGECAGQRQPRHTATPAAGLQYGRVHSRQPQLHRPLFFLLGQFIVVVTTTIRRAFDCLTNVIKCRVT